MDKPLFLFDMSGVLIDTDLDAIKSRVASAAGLSLEEINSSWKNDQYVASELGTITSEDYFDYYSRVTGLPWSYDTWINEWASIFSHNNNGFGLFYYLIQNKHEVHILSNLAEYHKIAVGRKLEGFWNLSCSNFLSYEMNLLKPDPIIYESVCRLTHTRPANCFYFDDVAENVASASKLGMNSFHFLDDTVEDMLQWIKENGIEG